MTCLDHIKAHTYHGRKGPVSNAFRYAIDYVLIDLAADVSRPTLFSRNQFNLMSLFDSDHGGAPKAGRGLAWARDVLKAQNLPGQERSLAFGPTAFTRPRVQSSELLALHGCARHAAGGDCRGQQYLRPKTQLPVPQR